MSWVGGKKALREQILAAFPVSYDKYVEVFGGAGWVLFGHKPHGTAEIYNDRNGLLVNLFRCVRDSPEELKDSLRYVLNSRTDFNRIKKQLLEIPEFTVSDDDPPDVRLASLFYQNIRFSYGSGLTSYGGRSHSLWADFPAIDAASHRLQRVVTENKDYSDLIQLHDSPSTFFYLDPPYWSTEGFYKNVGSGGFQRKNHVQLRNLLVNLKGKFLLSYNDCPAIRHLYMKPGILLTETSRLHNFRQRFEGGSEFKELLISNYDIEERVKQEPVQMDLFNTFLGGTQHENDHSQPQTGTDPVHVQYGNCWSAGADQTARPSR